MKPGVLMFIGLVMIFTSVGLMIYMSVQHQDEVMKKCQEKLSYDACYQILNR